MTAGDWAGAPDLSAEPPRPDPASPDDSALAGYIGYNLKRVLSLVQGDLAQVLAGFAFRAVSFSALGVVVRHPGISQSGLAEVLAVERSNLVQLVDELSGRGLIVRAPVAGDRRRHALMPTTEGLGLHAAAARAVAAHEARVFAMLDAGEQVALLALLAKVRAGWPGPV